jgi:galactose oxidase
LAKPDFFNKAHLKNGCLSGIGEIFQKPNRFFCVYQLAVTQGYNSFQYNIFLAHFHLLIIGIPMRIIYYSLALITLVLANSVTAGITISTSSIVAKHSGKCLYVQNGSTVNGNPVVQWNCNGGDNEQWTLKPYGDAYQIIVKHSGQCLKVIGALATDGAQIVQYPCQGANNELWYARPKGDYFQLVAKHSGKCLNVNAATKNDGGKIIQRTCAAADNQLWNIAGQAHTALQVKHSNQCLEVYGGSVADGAGIIQYPCHGTINQQWTLMPYQDAYRLIVKSSGKCLNVAGASLADGARVVQWSCVGGNNELWHPKINGNQYQLVAKHSNKCLTVNAASQVAATPVIQSACTSATNQIWRINVSSTTGGKWSKPLKLSLVPVAAANLPNGKVLLWSSHDRFKFGGGGKTYTATFDPATNKATERLIQEIGHDMFCPGTANLADGRILVNGGVNSKLTSIYNASTEKWSIGSLMNTGRGYQANTPLSNGDVFTLGGSWSGGYGNKNGEVWNASTGWRRTSNILASAIVTDDPQGVYRADNHGWYFGVGNQKVFHAGPSKQMNWFDTTGAGTSTPAGNRGGDGHSMNGNAAMFDIGKILKVGGATAYQNVDATSKAFIIDINNGVNVQPVANMGYARSYSSSVVLPNGQVVIIGGQAHPVPFSDLQPVLAAELWDPVTRNFSTLASMRIPRNYHSVALLLQDGRIFVGGGGLCGTCQTNHANAEIFTPPYLLNPDGSNAVRPLILQSPGNAGYGAKIAVSMDSAVSQFALVRLSSITHTVNNDLRRIPLNFTRTGTNAYSLQIPTSNGVAIPGFYMLFALNNAGVPSIAKVIKIG